MVQFARGGSGQRALQKRYAAYCKLITPDLAAGLRQHIARTSKAVSIVRIRTSEGPAVFLPHLASWWTIRE